MTRRLLRAGFAAAVLFAAVATPAAAQYFGRNKVQYDDFDFKVLSTEHFDIYFYPEEEEAVRDAARMAERWYRRHARTYLRDFPKKKSIIFYANDADFQQTNVIGGSIGEGTGGVTEALKQRVVMPLTGSYADTDHVLGHELVHSFQYDIAFSPEDSIRFNLGLLPLWLVEGTAEYLSIGRVDPHTAMWLRDAALRDDLPSIDQLNRDPRYFPYRYGQAYMAYIGGKYGDGALASLYKLAGRTGLDSAIVYTLGIDGDSLSAEWRDAVKSTYLPLLEGRTPADSAGRLVLARSKDAGDINLAPSVSPDGKYIAFLSERDVLNINLFIADAETGRIVEKLVDLNANQHFDQLRFISTAGSWSPDGKRFAFITFAQGDNEINIYNVDEGEIERRIAVEGVGAIYNPAWSPDGRTIAFAGTEGGISDLFLLDVETTQVRQLTRDRYMDMQPTWSPDGRALAFTTDRGPGGTDFETLEFGEPRLAVIDVTTEQIQVHVPFGDEVLHHNAQFSPDGQSLYFISDQDGFKDVYRLDLIQNQAYRITELTTGVTGITNLSPAMTVASQSGRMVYSVYGDNEYRVFSLEPTEAVGTPVAPLGEGIASAGVLPPLRAVSEGLVGNYLSDPETGLPPATVDYAVRDYRSRLTLDYIAPPTVGASVGGPFGTRLGGGVAFFFSDMLGNQNLTLVAQANGTVKDIGAQAQYFNQGGRLNWGAAAGHIPILYPYATYDFDQTGFPVGFTQIMQRIFIDQVSALAAYPFTTTRRAEASAGFVRYAIDYDLERYSLFGYGRQRIRDIDDLDPSDPSYDYYAQLFDLEDDIYFFQTSAAYVGDYSQTGYTSPILGGRYRFQAAPLVGSNSYLNLTADYRRYLYFRPFTFALRGLHIGNYGVDETDNSRLGRGMWREYLGAPYYQGFIRGYSFNDVYEHCGVAGSQEACFDDTRLYGSRIAVAGAELRIPVFGMEGLSLVNFPYLPTEVSLFADAGLAWSGGQRPILDFSSDNASSDLARRAPVTSAGVSTRVNILGAVVVEFYYAYPFQRPGRGAHFGWQLMPGW